MTGDAIHSLTINATYAYICRAVRVYDTATGEERKSFFFAGNVEALAWVHVEEGEEGGAEAVYVCV